MLWIPFWYVVIVFVVPLAVLFGSKVSGIAYWFFYKVKVAVGVAVKISKALRIIVNVAMPAEFETTIVGFVVILVYSITLVAPDAFISKIGAITKTYKRAHTFCVLLHVIYFI